MSTGPVNAKSKSYTLRLPIELFDLIDKYKYDIETTAKFVIFAIRAEAQKRARKEQRELREKSQKSDD